MAWDILGLLCASTDPQRTRRDAPCTAASLVKPLCPSEPLSPLPRKHLRSLGGIGQWGTMPHVRMLACAAWHPAGDCTPFLLAALVSSSPLAKMTFLAPTSRGNQRLRVTRKSLVGIH